MSWKAADGTGEVETLVESSSNQYPQDFSPDRTALVFEDRNSGFDLGMLSLAGERTSTLLLKTEFNERNAILSPDGRWMAYQSNESGQNELYVRPFPDVNVGGEGRRNYDISPDGQRFLMIQAVEGSTAQINVVLNWDEELKRLVPTK